MAIHVTYWPFCRHPCLVVYNRHQGDDDDDGGGGGEEKDENDDDDDQDDVFPPFKQPLCFGS